MFLKENKENYPELKSVRIISTPAPTPEGPKTFDSFDSDSDFRSDSASHEHFLAFLFVEPAHNSCPQSSG